MKNEAYINRIINADCREHLYKLEDDSIDLFLSDIPYGISLDDWDVLHNNTNVALLGRSPAQYGKSGFKRRGKPVRGWSMADREINKEYYDWCMTWTKSLYPIMKEGASLFLFGARRTIHRAIFAIEESGFILKDVLAWKKANAHNRAQKVSIVLERRGLIEEAEKWAGWRLGNLAPIYEPIAWFMKPYKTTITDVILEHGIGAMNIDEIKRLGGDQTNILEFWFGKYEQRYHEAQKPLSIMKFLITLTTREGHVVLDPFIGSGTTAVAAQELKRNFIGFEINQRYCEIAQVRLNDLKEYTTQVNSIEKQSRLV